MDAPMESVPDKPPGALIDIDQGHCCGDPAGSAATASTLPFPGRLLNPELRKSFLWPAPLLSGLSALSLRPGSPAGATRPPTQYTVSQAPSSGKAGRCSSSIGRDATCTHQFSREGHPRWTSNLQLQVQNAAELQAI
jgi:hypothetical protein